MSKDLPPSRTADQFVVRFPDGMRDQIAALAKANNRSMNAEIVARLQRSLEADQEVEQRTSGSGAAPEDVEQALAQIEQGARILKDVIRGRAELIAPKSITSGTGRAISGGSEVEAEEPPQKVPPKK